VTGNFTPLRWACSASVGRWPAASALALTYVGAALNLMGGFVQRLSLGLTTAGQLGGSFINRITPVKVGGMAVNVRYLQNQGLDSATTVGGVGISILAAGAMHVALTAVFIVWAGSKASIVDLACIVALFASVRAFDYPVSLAVAGAVYLTGTAVATAIPLSATTAPSTPVASIAWRREASSVWSVATLTSPIASGSTPRSSSAPTSLSGSGSASAPFTDTSAVAASAWRSRPIPVAGSR
jgi:hypothetical protein